MWRPTCVAPCLDDTLICELAAVLEAGHTWKVRTNASNSRLASGNNCCDYNLRPSPRFTSVPRLDTSLFMVTSDAFPLSWACLHLIITSFARLPFVFAACRYWRHKRARWALWSTATASPRWNGSFCDLRSSRRTVRFSVRREASVFVVVRTFTA